MTTRLTALVIGELTLAGDCLRLNDALLVWPPEFTVSVDGDTYSLSISTPISPLSLNRWKTSYNNISTARMSPPKVVCR